MEKIEPLFSKLLVSFDDNLKLIASTSLAYNNVLITLKKYQKRLKCFREANLDYTIDRLPSKF